VCVISDGTICQALLCGAVGVFPERTNNAAGIAGGQKREGHPWVKEFSISALYAGFKSHDHQSRASPTFPVRLTTKPYPIRPRSQLIRLQPDEVAIPYFNPLHPGLVRGCTAGELEPRTLARCPST